MGLLERIAAREDCLVGWCHEPRIDGTHFCRTNGHLNDFWMHRLRELSDGTYAVKAGPVGRFMAKELSPA